MKFRAEHKVEGISLPDFEALFFDEAFNIALCKALKLDRKLEERTLDDKGNFHRVTRVSPDRELPGPVAKVLGSNRLEYTEHMNYRMGSNHGTWRIISAIMSDKVDSTGTFDFTQNASGVVVRLIEGDVTVKVFGLGGMMERFIASDVERSYDDAARFTQQYIREGKAKRTS